jgi:hypothetical protein
MDLEYQKIMPLQANPLPEKQARALLELCPTAGSGLSWREAPPYKPQLKGKPAGFKHHSGYWYVTLGGVDYCSHRIVWCLSRGFDPGAKEVDHIDRDRGNNTQENLRLADRSLQMQNRGKSKNASSTFMGVSFNKASKKWVARCCLRKEDGLLTHTKYLGMFKTELEAWQEVLKHRPEWKHLS